MAGIQDLPQPSSKPATEKEYSGVKQVRPRDSDHKDIARGQRAIRDVLRTLERWRDRESLPDGH